MQRNWSSDGSASPTSDVFAHSQCCLIFSLTSCCRHDQPLASKAADHFLPWKTVLMLRSKWIMIVLMSTTPSLLANKLCSKSCRTYLLKDAKQCVSAGCNSHVVLAGTNTNQMSHLAHALRKRGPMCVEQTSSKRMG